ncbi:putative Xre family transcriptional regulator [Caenibius tardaugens NBRC 16725]|uniref:Putative Xre family transcriptional regulator n=1 Tax=Caenibius tardaugens NBRC 16725 TaxID=1219035 RepID=U2YHY4_9SPHN|nr:helix-turn-helix domain-containing protein [Caenibius tardaugens]AZI37143.1 XRE family transcriptional regulator [Caenibius tardaugens NBRC 16725]GAD47617.1 putative Xre family transcriptional regulator [Caenibius tardaugens NBRC 16725]
MINRIRDIRKEKGMTLADVAAACAPATTAQTIGRLETGMRNLSLGWMNRIAAALGVDPEMLVRGEDAAPAQIVARLTESGAEALANPRDAILPSDLAGGDALLCLAVDSSAGEYRAGDQLWLRQIAPEDSVQAINRDVLVPRKGGRFAFGRLIDRSGTLVGLLPPGIGQRQIVIDNPPWLAVAHMLVRKL